MKRRHLTLKGSMIAIAVIGVGVAALARPNKVWAFVLPPLAMTMNLTSILGILFRRGPRRAYWAGFALFGWAYLILNFVLFREPDLPNPSALPFRPISGASLLAVIELFMFPAMITSEDMGRVTLSELTAIDDVTHFVVACSVAGLVFAWIGGTIARLFASDEVTPARPASSSNPASGASKTDEPASPPSERPAGSQE